MAIPAGKTALNSLRRRQCSREKPIALCASPGGADYCSACIMA
jgi:hypothetical protein